MLENCVKCGEPAVHAHHNDISASFCRSCYTDNIVYKFRTALSATKLFNRNWNRNETPERVLILFEKDARAEVLLQLIHATANHRTQKRQMTFDQLIYEVHTGTAEIVAEEQSQIGNYIVNSIHLSSALNGSDQLKLYNDLLDAAPTKSIESEFKRLMFDLLSWKLGINLSRNIVITAENSETLAQKAMSALWFGRSTSVSEIASIRDSRHPTIHIARPLRNLSKTELDFISNPGNSKEYSVSNDPLSSHFLENVADNGFPAVVTTILSVASKLEPCSSVKNPSIDGQSLRCPLCMKKTTTRLCEPCNRLMSQIREDGREIVLNALSVDLNPPYC